MDRMLLVSADGHSGGPPELYRDYLEERYHPELDALIEVDRQWRARPIPQLPLPPGGGLAARRGEGADPWLGLPPMGEDSYEPFWAACAELGLTLTIHAAYGLPQIDRVAMGQTNMMEDLDDEARLRAGRTREISIDQFPEDS